MNAFQCNKLVSIIIPVYNSEKYLCECVESVLRQTYNNIQIILINDGSTDRSKDICDSFAIKDGRIKVIHNNNHGVSYARNLGIENAVGEFICFLDSDDWLSPEFIETFLKDFKNDIDLVYGGYAVYYENEMVQNVTATDVSKEICINKQFDFNSLDSRKRECWGVLYRREVLRDVRFDSNLFVGEDTLFFAKAMKQCRKVYYESKVLYNYRKLSESAINGSINLKKITEIESWFAIVRLFFDWPNSYRSSRKVCAYKLCSCYIKANEARSSQIKNRIEDIEQANADVVNTMDKLDRTKIYLAKHFPGLFNALKNGRFGQVWR